MLITLCVFGGDNNAKFFKLYNSEGHANSRKHYISIKSNWCYSKIGAYNKW